MSKKDDVVVNFYDDTGPQKIPQTEIDRVIDHAKEQGITKGTIKHISGGYIGLIVHKFLKGSKYEEGRKRRAAKAAAAKHLTATGSDTSGGNES